MDYFCGENSGKFVFCLKETRKRRMQFGLHSPELVYSYNDIKFFYKYFEINLFSVSSIYLSADF